MLWRAWREFNADRIPRVAGGVSFFALLALFPGMAAFVALYGMFGDVQGAEMQLSALAGLLPADALTFIGKEMVRIAAERHASLSATFVIGVLLSIWSANAGIKALIDGLNIAYEENEKRGLDPAGSWSALAGTVAALAFVTAMMAGAAGPAASAGHPASGPVVATAGAAALAGAAGRGDTLALALVYRFGPSREQPPRWRWSDLGRRGRGGRYWMAVSLLFSWYVGHVARFSVTYGSLGAIIGFMTWIWLSVIVILAGAEVNADLEHQTAIDSTTGQPRPMGLRGASAADSLGAARPGSRRRMARATALALIRRFWQPPR